MSKYNLSLWKKVFGGDFKTLISFLEQPIKSDELKKLEIKKVSDLIDRFAGASQRFGSITKDNSVLAGACKEAGFERNMLVKWLAGPQALEGPNYNDYLNNIFPKITISQIVSVIKILDSIQVPEEGVLLKSGYVVALPKYEMPKTVELPNGKALVSRKVTSGLYYYEFDKELQVAIETMPDPVAEVPVVIVVTENSALTAMGKPRTEVRESTKSAKPVKRHVNKDASGLDEFDFGLDNSHRRYPAKKTAKPKREP